MPSVGGPAFQGKIGAVALVSLLAGAAVAVAGPASAQQRDAGPQKRTGHDRESDLIVDCVAGATPTAEGCRRPAGMRRDLTRIVASIKRENGLAAVIARVDLGGRMLLRRAFGRSEAGVPATAQMSFRIGSMTLPAVSSVVLKLRDEGRLGLGDPVRRWFPWLPASGGVTVGMLLNHTSGYRDWIQGNEAFQAAQHANPFRHWREDQLLRIALRRGRACEPGGCFHYAHTNYLILGKLIRKITRSPTAHQLRSRMLRPLGMSSVHLSPFAPTPPPALNSYTAERGVFENATAWSPSWTLGEGMIATARIDDVARIGRGVLSGRALSRRSRRDFVARRGPILGPPPFSPYYAQGMIVINGWRIQNPYLNGYMANAAWLPHRRLSIAVVATRGPGVPPEDDSNLTDSILREIGAYLAPGNPLP